MRWRAELLQGGVIVAKVVASSQDAATREGSHYANMYWQDGPCELRIFAGRRLATTAIFEGRGPGGHSKAGTADRPTQPREEPNPSSSEGV